MKALKSKSRFVSLADLKSSIVEEIGPLEMDVVGYMKPGHGSKGKLQELDDDNALKEMYMLHKRKREILLGCYKMNLNRLAVNVAPVMRVVVAPPPKDAIAKSISDVETIVKVLQDTHGNLLKNIMLGPTLLTYVNTTHTMSRLITFSSLETRRKMLREIQGQVHPLILQRSV